MLEQLFGSRTRVKILRLFYAHPDSSFFVRELTRKVGEQINSVRRELENLSNMGILISEQKDRKKYYRLNQDFILNAELKALFLKSRMTLERKVINQIKETGSISYLALCGYFLDDQEALVDLFIIGRVNKRKLDNLLEKFSETFGQELRFTSMTTEEYRYRKDVTDKFLYEIINRDKVVVIDKLSTK
ncbi:winged helix-turn-helix domain-containing protein [Patescibacteria group bacterium]|nr:winged helix-turn-helix domain-containing protein [Patescibacteria group bacterium]